jgi:uncharacterized protein YlxP (DUF503 family)
MPFWIAVSECELMIPMAASLKDRRQVVRSIMDGARSRLSVSVADLGPENSYQMALLGFVAAGSSASELEVRMSKLEKFLMRREESGEFEMTAFSKEVIKHGDISD